MNPTDLPAHTRPTGRLDWRHLLKWLREDHVITAEDADRTKKRFGSADSSQHPLVRLGAAGLTRRSNGKPLDSEALTEWLAGRCGLPYLRIDPLMVDVGRVAEIMSISYAERRRALPLQLGAHEVTIATCEPFDTAWVAEIEGHMRKAIKLVLASPLELQRYTTEFYTLSRSGIARPLAAMTMVLPSLVGRSDQTRSSPNAAAMRRALRSKLASRPNRLTVITPSSASTRWQSR